MTIKICKLKFDAELAINNDLSGAEMEELRTALERTVMQRGIYSNFMIGQNQLEIVEKKK